MRVDLMLDLILVVIVAVLFLYAGPWWAKLAGIALMMWVASERLYKQS
jgi:hypothetical protein